MHTASGTSPLPRAVCALLHLKLNRTTRLQVGNLHKGNVHLSSTSHSIRLYYMAKLQHIETVTILAISMSVLNKICTQAPPTARSFRLWYKQVRRSYIQEEILGDGQDLDSAPY